MSLSTVTTTIEGDRVEVALAASYELGEGSLYAPGLAEGAGYLHVDILGKTVSVHRPDEPSALPGGAVVTYRVPSTVGTVVPVAGGKQLLVALAKGPALLTLGSGAVELIASAQVEPDVPTNRTNDGKVGPDGRFYFGTMHAASIDPRPTTGSLYVMDADGGVRTLLTGVTVSNGLGWSADGRTMYYIDTPTRAVQAFDFDGATGTIANGRVAFKIDPSLGAPDGMTMDAAGNLWIAMWGGWHVLGFRPDGTLFGRVRVPTAHVSSVAFGGKGLGDMYITTAKEFMDDATRAAQPAAGHVFIVRSCGFTGVPSHAFRPAASLPGLLRTRYFGMVTRLLEEAEAQYRHVHGDGFPGVRDLLVKHGMRNMSIFLQRMPDGKLYEFLYHEYAGRDFDGDAKALEAEPANAEWHRLCDPMQVHPLPESAAGSASGGSAWQVMEQVFQNT